MQVFLLSPLKKKHGKGQVWTETKPEGKKESDPCVHHLCCAQVKCILCKDALVKNNINNIEKEIMEVCITIYL